MGVMGVPPDPPDQQQLGIAWGDPIREPRTRELEDILDAWEGRAEHTEDSGPFSGVALSGADVFWLAARALVRSGAATDINAAQACLRRAGDRPGDHLSLDLTPLHLEYADLHEAHLEGAVLSNAHLDHANLVGSWLEGANLARARLRWADIRTAHLEGADLTGVLMGLEAPPSFMDFSHDARVNLDMATFKGTDLRQAHLERATLAGAQLQRAALIGAHLEGADLFVAHLEGAFLNGAHFEGKSMAAPDLDRIRRSVPAFPSQLSPADLRGVYFDDATSMWGMTLTDPQRRHGVARVADARWGGSNVAVIDWDPIKRLGDEEEVRASRIRRGSKKRVSDLRAAIRACRQVADALEAQGSNEDAVRFSLSARKLQRRLYFEQGKYGPGLWSLFLEILAGYGFRWLQTVGWYLGVVAVFAFLYVNFGHLDCHPTAHSASLQCRSFRPQEAIVFSLTSFHGRGFFPGGLALDDPVTMLAAIEAVFGLFIEISFIATFTQRYFGTK